MMQTLVLKEVVLERVLVEYLVERVGGADMVVEQKLTDLRHGITLGDSDLKRVGRGGVGQLAPNVQKFRQAVETVPA